MVYLQIEAFLSSQCMGNFHLGTSVDPVVHHCWVVQFGITNGGMGLTSGITSNAFLLGHQGTNLSTSGESGAY